MEKSAFKHYRFLLRHRQPLFLALLGVSLLIAYSPVLNHGFINFDDNVYVTNNDVVQKGLTYENLLWAFDLVNEDRAYWHPLAWLSHMLDCQLFGLDAGGHHLVSLLLHIANSILLYLVFKNMTAAFFPSAVIAGLFALHPLSVDSVAWIAERKNLLSTFFWMLTTLAYLSYAKRPGFTRYLVVVGLFVTGLLAKPMLVTLPCVFLLLDYWPLRRAGSKNGKEPHLNSPYARAPWYSLVGEKVPLLIISFTNTALSSYSLKATNSIIQTDLVPMSLRVENAIVVYVKYLRKVLWPNDLAIYYPFPETILFWTVLGAAVVLTAVSGFAVLKVVKRPWLAIGWFWFLGTLFPVIGLVQGGLWPEMADRWMYIPQIGIFIIFAWSLHTARVAGKVKRASAAAICLCLFAGLMVATRTQVGHWQNDRTLFSQAVRVTRSNPIAHGGLSGAFLAEKNYAAAIKHADIALSLDPQHRESLINKAAALLELQDFDQAAKHYAEVISIDPVNVAAHYGLAHVYLKKGDDLKALEGYRAALKLQPDHAMSHKDMGVLLIKARQYSRALDHLSQALDADSADFAVHYNMGLALFHLERKKEALIHFTNAMEIEPDSPETYHKIGQIHLEKGNLSEAIKNLEKALSLEGDNADTLVDLAGANRAAGKNKRAIELYHQALAVKPPAMEVYYNLGVLYAESGNLVPAEAFFQRALHLAAEDPSIHFGLGIIYAQTGRYDAALHSYAQVLAYNPDHAGAQRNRQQIIRLLDALNEEIESAQNRLRQAPRDAGLVTKLGDLYWQKGDYATAGRLYQTALAARPAEPALLNRAGSASAKTGDYRTALSTFKQLSQLFPDNGEAYYNVACMYSRLNETDQSLQWLEQAIHKGYDNWDNLEFDEDLENVRSAPRFKELMGRH